MSSDPNHPSPQEQETESIGEPWRKVKALFESAVQLEGAERESFLNKNCPANDELRKQVDALLSDYADTSGFLEKPIASIRSLADDLFTAPNDPQRLGTRVGAYRLEEEIGSGGMGIVFRATRADSEYDKRVAVKLVRDSSKTEEALRRFRHERQILARLENPYIARLIDGGTTAEGTPYFVMEYVEGQTILQYCKDHSLTNRDRLHLFLKVCSAVQYAHDRNIIHRDLKPGNIMVKKDGTPKLLDFGIAKILGAESLSQEATMAGFAILTPAYASPEQLRGESATVQSDVYALGVILYELLCHRRLDTDALNSMSIGSVQPHEAQLSTPLLAVVRRPIQPDPRERYVSVEALAADIQRYLAGTPPLAASPASIISGQTELATSLAVLPLRYLGEPTGIRTFLGSGITEALITKLSRLERLSVPPPSAVQKFADGIDAVTAARDLKVRYILEGSIQNAGESTRVKVQLVWAEAGITVWAGQMDSAETDPLLLEDSLAEQIANAIVPHLGGEERSELARSGTANGSAYAAYQRGRWFWSQSIGDQQKLAQSLVCFSEAVAIDPKFARAHAGLADYYLRLGLWGGLPPAESFAAAVESARRAVQLEPTLAEAHASLAFATWAYYGDERSAEEHFNLATVRNPNYANAHHWYGLLNSVRNRPELAIANLERAKKVDPNSGVIAAALGFVQYNARSFGRARQLLSDASLDLPKSSIIPEMLCWCYLQTGDIQAALDAARRAVQLSQQSTAALSALASAEAAAGNREAVHQVRQTLDALSGKQYVSHYDRASVCLVAGVESEALRHLEQAQIDRDWWVYWIGVDPRWDKLRDNPRFNKLLRKKRKPDKQRRILALAAAGVALMALSIWWIASRSTSTPFENVRFTKLTSNGLANSAVIAPDGKSVVYSAMDAGGSSLWYRQMATGQITRLVPRMSGKVTDLNFIEDGNAVEFVNFPLTDPSNRRLYMASLAGGSLTQISGTFPGPVRISPDGTRAAFYISNPEKGTDELWDLEIKSGNRRLLLALHAPDRLAGTCTPSWSPDGKSIAYAAEDHDKIGFLVRIHTFNLKTNEHRLIASPRWQWVESVAWAGDQSALTVVGQEHESSFQQIWYIPLRRGAQHFRRIGNDLDDYFGASLTRLGSEIVTVQAQTLSNVYVAKPGELNHPLQITVGGGRYFDLSWTAKHQILYASDATGSADLWIMNQDGSGQQLVVSGKGRNYAPAASPHSDAIAFHSNRSGNWQVWRSDFDGKNPRQLSPNAGDGNWPQFTPDGKFVIFHRTGAKSTFNLWRVPASGGQPVQITQSLTMHPAVSLANGRIAAWYSETVEEPHWKIAVFPPEGGNPLKVFQPTPDLKPDTPLRWTPNGDAITFVNYGRAGENVWLQPVNGGAAHPLTSFHSGEIYSFDWSRDGSLILSQGMTTADVVLVRDINRSGDRK